MGLNIQIAIENERDALRQRVAELLAALDELHMHASPGAPGWIMVPFTEWVQVFSRVGFPKSEEHK